MLDIAPRDSGFNPASEIIDTETGEVIHDGRQTLGYKLSLVSKSNKNGRRRVIRGYRYKVLRMARETLMGTSTPKGNRWRTCDCQRLPIPLKETVVVAQSPATGAAAFRNLVSCGSVWTCPVCASKIAGVRRDEVREALEKHLGEDRVAVSITLTVRHGVSHSAARLLSAMGGALKRFRANRSVRDIREAYGFRGQIRALEVTYGEKNGWHPHFHEVWFFDTKLWSETSTDEVKKQLARAWISAVVTSGLPAPTEQVGVVVKRIDVPRDYEGKGNASIDGIDGWDAADELTRGIAKNGRGDRYSPFDLLVAGEFGRFQEYARAFHGKRQLTWSPGLKGHFAIGDRSDEEIAADDESNGVAVMEVQHKDWMRALGVMPELASMLLDRVETAGAADAVAWLTRMGYIARLVEPPGLR